MTKQDKGKQLAIAIENLVTNAVSAILNVKTKTIAQTALRDDLIRRIGFMFESVVDNNRKAVEKGTPASDDLDKQYHEAIEDFEAMSRASVILNQRFPRKQPKTAEQRHQERFGK